MTVSPLLSAAKCRYRAAGRGFFRVCSSSDDEKRKSGSAAALEQRQNSNSILE
ncbi:MAG: hypothetical protein K2X55_25220 [Burkholderiaceae bacterium]|nr:hypothetical protein [Burkholderiaceae bacterium]